MYSLLYKYHKFYSQQQPAILFWLTVLLVFPGDTHPPSLTVCHSSPHFFRPPPSF